MPAYARSAINDTAITEPLIETVWKMLINAHSYCYIYFTDYFNDHHTFTVALLPLFTNKIQDIWLQGYLLGEAFPNNVLYGGLLGDIKRVMKNVDYCTAASKQASPYPWIINRPPRDKSNVWRKKRETLEETREDFLQFECIFEQDNICSNFQ
ncbi:unnamed protein product [Orchesella dallaii]|uniref:Uncharacterized protein n=1 Tax=Orchesella dallaii TaxID=48710 RepID=A0ABP1PTU0_9HEXA